MLLTSLLLKYVLICCLTELPHPIKAHIYWIELCFLRTYTLNTKTKVSWSKIKLLCCKRMYKRDVATHLLNPELSGEKKSQGTNFEFKRIICLFKRSRSFRLQKFLWLKIKRNLIKCFWKLQFNFLKHFFWYFLSIYFSFSKQML